MCIKVATFHIPAHNRAYAYMSLGTVEHCHFTWVASVPFIADESRSIGAFYARKNQYHKKKGHVSVLQKRILARRQEWLKRA